MSIHSPGCECDTLGCKMRREGAFNLSSAATPTRMGRRPFRPGAGSRYNGWERGIAGETRRDGSFMPYLTSSGGPMHVKEHAENRATLSAARERQLTGPALE